MAETFLNDLGEGKFLAESAGWKKGSLILVVEVMAELGYDISNNKTDSVFDFFKEGRRVRLRDQGLWISPTPSNAQSFLEQKLVELGLRDPSSFTGTYDERLAQTRAVRDAIKTWIEEFLRVVVPG